MIDPSSLSGDQKALYEQMMGSLIPWANQNGFEGVTPAGELIGPFNPYLYTPITPGFLKWMDADKQFTSLSKRVHEVVILSTGAVWQSPFELYAHSAVARTVGLPEGAIEALVKGGTSDELTPEEQVAHRFARTLTQQRRVDDALYAEAKAVFGERGLVDMAYLVGMYLFTCALLNVFEIPAPK